MSENIKTVLYEGKEYLVEYRNVRATDKEYYDFSHAIIYPVSIWDIDEIRWVVIRVLNQ